MEMTYYPPNQPQRPQGLQRPPIGFQHPQQPPAQPQQYQQYRPPPQQFQRYPPQIPSGATTFWVTLLFGLFGLVPAITHSNKAAQYRQPTGRYWAAFGSAAVIWAATVITIIVTTGLFGPGTIDPQTVQSSMETTMTEKGINGTIDNLDCPEMTAEKGATYTCIATIDGTDKAVEVTVQDDEGSIYWKMTG